MDKVDHEDHSGLSKRDHIKEHLGARKIEFISTAIICAVFALLCLPSNLNIMSSYVAAKLINTKINSIGKRWYWYMLPRIGSVSLLLSKLSSVTTTSPFEI